MRGGIRIRNRSSVSRSDPLAFDRERRRIRRGRAVDRVALLASRVIRQIGGNLRTGSRTSRGGG